MISALRNSAVDGDLEGCALLELVYAFIIQKKRVEALCLQQKKEGEGGKGMGGRQITPTFGATGQATGQPLYPIPPRAGWQGGPASTAGAESSGPSNKSRRAKRGKGKGERQQDTEQPRQEGSQPLFQAEGSHTMAPIQTFSGEPRRTHVVVFHRPIPPPAPLNFFQRALWQAGTLGRRVVLRQLQWAERRRERRLEGPRFPEEAPGEAPSVQNRLTVREPQAVGGILTPDPSISMLQSLPSSGGEAQPTEHHIVPTLSFFDSHPSLPSLVTSSELARREAAENGDDTARSPLHQLFLTEEQHQTEPPPADTEGEDGSPTQTAIPTSHSVEAAQVFKEPQEYTHEGLEFLGSIY
eukprot:Cvel_23985.t1-p1 / transcript=Cvel_23985.t1 / gene=Cvel_23985 / organism=Chromera_velia_CCMP2878 / gene_product=hypothetical protein / transcript_product=hypothetical protein / location=Cvel_scaffold2541:1-13895(-) / protein_length=353 / sequence_SO=supercontig / SO=protein_coding / is_pseudo=false